MAVCCIVFDIDGILFEFFMNFLNIEKNKNFKIKKFGVKKKNRGGGGGGGVDFFFSLINSFSLHVFMLKKIGGGGGC